MYDPVAFRMAVHRSAAAFKALAVIFEIIVWRLSRNLDLYGDDAKQEKTKEEQLADECEPLNK